MKEISLIHYFTNNIKTEKFYQLFISSLKNIKGRLTENIYINELYYKTKNKNRVLIIEATFKESEELNYIQLSYMLGNLIQACQDKVERLSVY